jgi:hypothetical protein
MKLSLSKIEREKRPEAFEVELTDGTVVEFADPKRMHFSVLVELDNLPMLEQLAALTGDGFEALKADPNLDAEALETVMTAWRDHYGVGDQGEARSSRG